MTARTTSSNGRPRVRTDRYRGRSSSWWGMMLLILTEAAFFASIIAAYHYLRVAAPAWPPEGTDAPSLLIPIVNTVLLLGSSAAYIAAERGLRRGHKNQLSLGLLISIILAVIFLSLQLYEYADSPLKADTDPYGALFFAVTGLHGLHVFVGLIMLVATLTWAVKGTFNSERHDTVTNVGLYWHFVDAVWLLLVFPSVYLSPWL